MPGVHHLKVKDGDVLVLVGTTKGAFLLQANEARKRWEVGGPYFAGNSIYALALDQRQGSPRLWASAQSFRWGTVLASSDNFGKNWTEPETYPLKFPGETGATLKNIWQIKPGRAQEPQTLFCGVEPSALFRSDDNGQSWALVQGLWNHPHREKWMPGGGGQCLHTILPDPVNPQRLSVAMSTGGVYRTDDGGQSWQPRNQGIKAEFLPDKYPEFGQCVHKVVGHPSNPQRLFLQNHWGVYRSDDGGDQWQAIEKGVPSTFGFAMAAHPHDPDVVYNVPIESDEFRCTPEGKLRVYRTANAGKSWEPLARGLPQKNALETVLRDGLATDTCAKAGVYFGTRSGKLYGSADEGRSWELLQDGLPPVLSVQAAVVGESKSAKSPRARARKKSR